jgi:tellurium resistance protein TerD
MAVNLSKGGRVNLSKDNPGLSKISVALGWDDRSTDGAEFDLDASVFLLDDAGKAIGGDDALIFYNNLKGLGGAVAHMGDNRTGEGEGDDEVIEIDLPAVVATNPSVNKFAFVVTIHEADARNQNFGQVENAFIRIVNRDTGAEIVRYDLTEDYSVETALIFGELYVKDGEWRFGAVGQGFSGGLEAALKKYGLV